MKLSKRRARQVLLAIWAFFFVINLAIVLYLYLDHWIESDNFDRAVNLVSALYAPYLGVMLLYYWGKRKARGATRDAPTAFVLALGATLVWNLIVMVFFGRLLVPSGTIEDSLAQIENLSKGFSWLVAGAIGAYFGTDT